MKFFSPEILFSCKKWGAGWKHGAVTLRVAVAVQMNTWTVMTQTQKKKKKKTFVIFLFFFFLWHVPVGDDPSKRVDWVGAGSVRGTNQSTTTSKYILSVWSDHSAQIYNEIKEKLARRVSVRDFFFCLEGSVPLHRLPTTEIIILCGHERDKKKEGEGTDIVPD